jgi:hypothetical protein
VLKPAHAVYRLQTQHFALGDRVTMVQDSGGVPLSVKGVVIGLNAKSMDVVWDVPFMSGITLGDRCVFTVYLFVFCFPNKDQVLAVSWIDGGIQYVPQFDESTIRDVHQPQG